MNDIITNKKNIIKLKIDYSNINTVLVMDFKEDITEYLDNSLPYPSSHFVNEFKYSYTWVISGVFHTKKGTDYYNDIISRILISFKDYGVRQQKTYRTLKPTTLELKHFLNLRSLTFSKMIKRNRDNKEDFVFWCLKDFAEEVIRKKGLITYTELLDFAFIHFLDYKKGFSTIKSKCRSIVNYYINNDYTIYEYKRKTNTKEEWIMLRTENMKEINKNKEIENKKLVQHFLSGLFIEEYKKPNGKWNYTKISKNLKLTRQTIQKHITDLGL